MLKLAIFVFIFACAGLLTEGLLPLFAELYHKMQAKKAEEATKKLDNLFVEVEKKKLLFIFILSPLLLTVLGLFLYRSLIAGIVGGFVGIAIPNFFISIWEKRRKEKFRVQLLDSLMLLSGCLKAGLSLTQAFEVLIEDMPVPVSQEFGWVLKEIKMGISLEESLRRLNKRMPSEELRLITNAVLVASITGGDLPKVFSRIVTTILDNRKVKENITTLTLQGRLQGTIMSILPFIFIWWLLTFNKGQFDIMYNSETGRTLLFVAAGLLVVGIFLIRKFSTLKNI